MSALDKVLMTTPSCPAPLAWMSMPKMESLPPGPSGGWLLSRVLIGVPAPSGCGGQGDGVRFLGTHSWASTALALALDSGVRLPGKEDGGSIEMMCQHEALGTRDAVGLRGRRCLSVVLTDTLSILQALEELVEADPTSEHCMLLLCRLVKLSQPHTMGCHQLALLLTMPGMLPRLLDIISMASRKKDASVLPGSTVPQFAAELLVTLLKDNSSECLQSWMVYSPDIIETMKLAAPSLQAHTVETVCEWAAPAMRWHSKGSAALVPEMKALLDEVEAQERDGIGLSPDESGVLAGLTPPAVACVTMTLRLVLILSPRPPILCMLFGQGLLGLMEKMVWRCALALMPTVNEFVNAEKMAKNAATFQRVELAEGPSAQLQVLQLLRDSVAITTEVLYRVYKSNPEYQNSDLPMALFAAYQAVLGCPELMQHGDRHAVSTNRPATAAVQLRHMLARALALWVGSSWVPALLPRVLRNPLHPAAVLATLALVGDMLPCAWVGKPGSTKKVVRMGGGDMSAARCAVMLTSLKEARCRKELGGLIRQASGSACRAVRRLLERLLLRLCTLSAESAVFMGELLIELLEVSEDVARSAVFDTISAMARFPLFKAALLAAAVPQKLVPYLAVSHVSVRKVVTPKDAGSSAIAEDDDAATADASAAAEGGGHAVVLQRCAAALVLGRALCNPGVSLMGAAPLLQRAAADCPPPPVAAMLALATVQGLSELVNNGACLAPEAATTEEGMAALLRTLSQYPQGREALRIAAAQQRGGDGDDTVEAAAGVTGEHVQQAAAAVEALKLKEGLPAHTCTACADIAALLRQVAEGGKVETADTGHARLTFEERFAEARTAQSPGSTEGRAQRAGGGGAQTFPEVWVHGEEHVTEDDDEEEDEEDEDEDGKDEDGKGAESMETEGAAEAASPGTPATPKLRRQREMETDLAAKLVQWEIPFTPATRRGGRRNVRRFPVNRSDTGAGGSGRKPAMHVDAYMARERATVFGTAAAALGAVMDGVCVLTQAPTLTKSPHSGPPPGQPIHASAPPLPPGPRPDSLGSNGVPASASAASPVLTPKPTSAPTPAAPRPPGPAPPAGRPPMAATVTDIPGLRKAPEVPAPVPAPSVLPGFNPPGPRPPSARPPRVAAQSAAPVGAVPPPRPPGGRPPASATVAPPKPPAGFPPGAAARETASSAHGAPPPYHSSGMDAGPDRRFQGGGPPQGPPPQGPPPSGFMGDEPRIHYGEGASGSGEDHRPPSWGSASGGKGWKGGPGGGKGGPPMDQWMPPYGDGGRPPPGMELGVGGPMMSGLDMMGPPPGFAMGGPQGPPPPQGMPMGMDGPMGGMPPGFPPSGLPPGWDTMGGPPPGGGGGPPPGMPPGFMGDGGGPPSFAPPGSTRIRRLISAVDHALGPSCSNCASLAAALRKERGAEGSGIAEGFDSFGPNMPPPSNMGVGMMPPPLGPPPPPMGMDVDMDDLPDEDFLAHSAPGRPPSRDHAMQMRDAPMPGHMLPPPTMSASTGPPSQLGAGPPPEFTQAQRGLDPHPMGLGPPMGMQGVNASMPPGVGPPGPGPTMGTTNPTNSLPPPSTAPAATARKATPAAAAAPAAGLAAAMSSQEAISGLLKDQSRLKSLLELFPDLTKVLQKQLQKRS
ncbi:hypothetical protein CYMTET_11585 [Cymbomonas tetramitiformis]|uniref:Uncharacterized protein n=1 Tax=Cymbomonas tetramitiformis TaxID=36881 RepID=A0AAE0GNE6_9CHLO|nr:hypothetical protein CYMTET_11585 [Cymbomonas tetramitiformis]